VSGSYLETPDVVLEPECTKMRPGERNELLWRVSRRSHAPFAAASTRSPRSMARGASAVASPHTSPDRSRIPCTAERHARSTSATHTDSVFKTSTHVSCSYQRLRADGASGSRRCASLRRARFGSGSPHRASCVRLLPEPRHGRSLPVPSERCRSSDDPSPRRRRSTRFEWACLAVAV